MGARYIYRIDDIVPGMNRDQFKKFMDLFAKYGVKPLLGIVPDNRDKELSSGEDDGSFWQFMRQLQADGTAEFAQHGYQHMYVTKRQGMLGKRYGYFARSEFAGLPYEEQLRKINAGCEILRREGINTRVWMSPSHSFDGITLKALRDAGFDTVTDGIALFPYRKKGLVFIPQQAWRPESYPFGIITVCLHTGHAGDDLYRDVEEHLKSCACFTTISSAGTSGTCLLSAIANTLFRIYFVSKRYSGLVKKRINRLSRRCRKA